MKKKIVSLIVSIGVITVSACGTIAIMTYIESVWSNEDQTTSKEGKLQEAAAAIKKGDAIEHAGGKGSAQKALDQYQKAYDIYKEIGDEPGMSNMRMKIAITKRAVENEHTPGTYLPSAE